MKICINIYSSPENAFPQIKFEADNSNSMHVKKGRQKSTHPKKLKPVCKKAKKEKSTENLIQ